MACAIPESLAEYDCARSGRALGKAITSEDRFIMSILSIQLGRSYDACAETSTRLPVRCPLPEVTPLKARTSLPSPVGFGFGPKLNLTVFHVSPRCACRPKLAVGS